MISSPSPSPSPSPLPSLPSSPSPPLSPSSSPSPPSPPSSLLLPPSSPITLEEREKNVKNNISLLRDYYQNSPFSSPFLAFRGAHKLIDSSSFLSSPPSSCSSVSPSPSSSLSPYLFPNPTTAIKTKTSQLDTVAIGYFFFEILNNLIICTFMSLLF